MTDPPTEQQLDEIETRAAHLHEYATLTDEPLQADADQLTGKDVPALVAALRDSRAEIDKLIRWHGEDETAMKRMRATISRLRAELAASRTQIADEIVEWSGQRIGVHVPTVDAIADALRASAWAGAVRAASAPSGAPVSASQPSSVSESAQSPTGAAEGALRDSAAPGDFRSETEISARGWTA